jgi:hypothetical protein
MTRQNRWLLYPAAMRPSVAMHVVASSCLILLALLAAGCGATTLQDSGASPASTPAPMAQTSQADRAVTPVFLRNPAPDKLDVSMAVTFDQVSSDPQPMMEVGLEFLSGGRTVQFTGDERLICDGTALSPKNRAATFQVLRAPTAQVAGTTIRCTYTAAGAVASVSLRIPPAPAITFPREGAQVTRSPRTVVTYHYDPTTATMLGVVALAPGSPSPKALAQLNTPGPARATVDTSQFAPGSGTLVLTASLTPRITGGGALFKSVSAFGTGDALVEVTWT